MMNVKTKITVFLVVLIYLCTALPPVAANAPASDRAANFIYECSPHHSVSSVGGEWAVIGLTRCGARIPDEYFKEYISIVKSTLFKCSGVLHDRKYTEYSRLILALSALGIDPQKICGYNLIAPLSDYDKTVFQGTTGTAWALIALDSKGYELPPSPNAKVTATREMYISDLLSRQHSGGGWSLSENSFPDPDITAMALTALRSYKDRADVSLAIESALTYLSAVQTENGGFASYGAESAESCAQVIIALCALGIDIDEPRFIKNNNTVYDALISFQTEGGGFMHTKDTAQPNLMASEQALLALTALSRFKSGEPFIFDMSDVDTPYISDMSTPLPTKSPLVKPLSVIHVAGSFSDTLEIPEHMAIDALAARNIVNGKNANSFAPSEPISRAELAAIVVRALGLDHRHSKGFSDVKDSDWFFSSVSTAADLGIVNGISETLFNPRDMVTREDAAVMLRRAAELCGMKSAYDAQNSRDTLSSFTDCNLVSDYALDSLAFCYNTGILSETDDLIRPSVKASRAEVAQMVYNMLYLSGLIAE